MTVVTTVIALRPFIRPQPYTSVGFLYELLRVFAATGMGDLIKGVYREYMVRYINNSAQLRGAVGRARDDIDTQIELAHRSDRPVCSTQQLPDTDDQYRQGRASQEHKAQGQSGSNHEVIHSAWESSKSDAERHGIAKVIAT